ncbi:hypothetical protein E2C01_092471 [Portunus trituberculatus]|uniref:Uncharacterized protein n=1 Tax=Portunus trituberculatus TaxID=210409 RepID=A0A5B7JRU3_PORTR|nr:hypothetical protein [Portunus trituberculatus]
MENTPALTIHKEEIPKVLMTTLLIRFCRQPPISYSSPQENNIRSSLSSGDRSRVELNQVEKRRKKRDIKTAGRHVSHASGLDWTRVEK